LTVAGFIVALRFRQLHRHNGSGSHRRLIVIAFGFYFAGVFSRLTPR